MRLKTLYESGGDFNENQKALMGNLMAVGSLATTAVDALDAPNRYGRQSTGTNMLKSGLAGASAGATFGPVGAAVGGGLGLLTGFVSAQRQKAEERRTKTIESNASRQAQLAQTTARASQDPFLTSGNPDQEYFASGGTLKSDFIRYKATGGTLSKLSSDTVEVKGAKHAQGGVDLPQVGAEVEGGETIKGNYVLSHRLGFAQLHKPIAKAIGLIEKKGLNPISTKSLERLRKQEESLILMQEYVKSKNNIQ